VTLLEDAALEPVRELGLDEINLSEQSFWELSEETREGAFATLREQRPVAWFEAPDVGDIPGLEAGSGYWALTRHADVLEASRNPELFSSDSSRGGTQIIDLPAEYSEFFTSMISMDDPRHARLRGLISAGFTPRMLGRIEQAVERAAREVVDSVIEKGECDFVLDVASPFPLMIICDMMGIPRSQLDFVFDRSNIILGAGDPDYVADVQDMVVAQLTAGAELAQLMEELRTERIAKPTDDITSVLVNAEVDSERLTAQELSSFFVLLAVAGNETTRTAISQGFKALHDNPDQKRLWMDDFDGLNATAIEEIVRWATPVIHFRRTVTRDTVIGGQAVKEGDKVVMWYNSANRDEDVFERPFDFDLARSPNEHLGFGGPGPHFCLGANLARREITVLFRELFSRMPDIRPTGDPDRLLSFFINGLKRMPAEFTPGALSAS
jgi:cytochrome P450